MSFFIPKNISGCRDQLPAEMLAKKKINYLIKTVFASFGFSPMYSSTMERYDFLRGKYGDEEKYFYHLKDESRVDMVLRYDLVVPILRIISEYPELNLPLRYYHQGTVWRNRKPGKINFKEFVQIAFAIIGAKSVLAEAEIIQICSEILKACRLEKYVIRLNNKKILTGFLKSIGFQEQDLTDLGRVIDKFYYLGEETFLLSLKELGIEESERHQILNFLHLSAGWTKNFKDIKDRFSANEAIQKGLEELNQLVEFLNQINIPRNKFVIDFSVAKRLENYTGLMFEINIEDVYLTPTVISGGRYDDLMGTYADRQIPAVGATVSYDRLFIAMKELDLIEEKQSPAKILVTVYNKERVLEAHKLARELRANKINTALYYDFDPLEKQIKYAGKKTIPLVAIIGPKEIQNKKVILKETKNNREELVERDRVAAVIKKKLGIL